jgi:hypothetical protein
MVRPFGLPPFRPVPLFSVVLIRKPPVGDRPRITEASAA